jgi:hypothetical protein
MVEFNRRVADSAQSGWESAKTEDAAALRRRGTRAARELTRFTLGRKSDPEAVWQGALEVLQDGVNGEEAREVVSVARNIIDSWLALAQKTRELWQDVAATTGAEPEMLDDLEKAQQEVERVKSAAEKVYAFFTRPWAPIDQDRLRKGLEEAAQGRLKSPEEMLARFKAPKA